MPGQGCLPSVCNSGLGSGLGSGHPCTVPHQRPAHSSITLKFDAVWHRRNTARCCRPTSTSSVPTPVETIARQGRRRPRVNASTPRNPSTKERASAWFARGGTVLDRGETNVQQCRVGSPCAELVPVQVARLQREAIRRWRPTNARSSPTHEPSMSRPSGFEHDALGLKEAPASGSAMGRRLEGDSSSPK